MQKALKKMFASAKGGLSVATVVVEVVLVVALVPIIAIFIADATNLTTLETTLLGLTTLFIILGLVFSIAKDAGLIKK